MSFTSLLHSVTAAGLASLADFDRDAALAAGLSSSTVNAWKLVHDTYYASCRFSKQQRLAREKAIAGAFSLDQLATIERRIKKAKGLAAAAAWKVRHQLLSTPRRHDALERAAKKLIPTTPATPIDGVSFTRSRNGKRSLRVTTDERVLADLEHALSRDIDTAAPAGPQMLARFVSLLRSPGGEGIGNGGGVPAAAPRPLILVPLPDWVKINRGEGADTVLGLSDGTTMLGAEFFERFVATEDNHLEAALIHPVEGAVDMYRLARNANSKQRALVSAMMPVCVVPGCKQPADSCQMHHMTAWKHGGETNVSNLAPLCRYHNQVNDDDAETRGGTRPRSAYRRRNAGTVVPVGAVPIWRSPRGYLIPNDEHQNYRFGAMTALFGDRGQAAGGGPSPPEPP